MTPTPPPVHIRGFQALIGAERWSSLLSQGNHRFCPAGSRLLDQGGPSRLVHALKKGRVRVVYTEDGGNEVLMAVRGPGDLLGEYAQRDRSEHMATVWTLDDCEFGVLPTDSFEAVIHHLHIGDILQQYILQKYRQIPQRLWRIANLQTEQRMALLFLEILGADPNSDESVVPMTQQQVADSLGVARSSVTRLLAEWKQAGVVSLHQSRLEVLDPASLARRANRG
jgi:CRP-like cAMP-binding protein